MPINNIQADMIKAMTKATDILYQEMIQRLASPDYPNEIAEATKTLPVKVDGGRVIGTIEIDLNKAEMALAFELGSGIHAEKGPRGTYKIQPKDAQALAFRWNPQQEPWGSPKFIGKTPDGRYLFRWVDHPGIKARPYIQPSIEAKAQEITQLLGNFWVTSLSKQLGPEVEVIR